MAAGILLLAGTIFCLLCGLIVSIRDARKNRRQQELMAGARKYYYGRPERPGKRFN